MKVKASVKKICPKCQIVRRSSKSNAKGKNKSVLRVICSNGRHRQRQG